MKNFFRPRLIALSTAAVLLLTLALGATPAHADKKKERQLKYGAIAAGVVGAYLLSKGKTIEGAAAAGGAYYAYKKSKDERRNGRNRNRRVFNDEEVFPQGFQPRDRDFGGDYDLRPSVR